MSAPNFTPIQLYRTATAAATPSAGNLADGELAINLTDEKLYFKNASGVVKLLASNSGSLGSVTSVDASGSTTGLTFTGGPITSSGTLTLGGTLVVGNGGTGTSTQFTAGSVVFAGASGVYSQSNANLFWDNGNARLGIGTASPTEKLDVNGVIKGGVATGVTLLMADSSAIRNTASAGNTMYFDSGVGAGSTTGDFQFRSTASYTTRFYIDGSTGRVGVGTTSPARLLEVTASGTNIPARLGNSQGNLDIGGSDGVTVNIDTRSWAMGLQTGGTERMRITTGGDVGIGTSAPGYKLDIVGNSPNINLKDNTAGVNWYQGPNSSNLYTFGNNAGSPLNTAFLNTNVGIGTSSPGQRLDVNGSINTANNLFTGNGSGVWFNGSASFSTGIASSTTNMLFYTSNSERMRIDSSGNLGIGTSSPSVRLDIAGADAAFRATSANAYGDFTNGSGTLRLQVSGPDGFITQTNAGSLIFRTNNTERMRITSDGDLLVGRTTVFSAVASYRTLQVNGALGGIVDMGNASGVYGRVSADLNGLNVEALGATYTAFRTDNTERMRIDSSGNLGIGTSSPGTRLDVWTPNGTATTVRWAQNGVTNYDWRIPASTDAFTLNYGGTTERMRINSSGDMLVNATSDWTGGYSKLYSYTSAASSRTISAYNAGSSAGASAFLGRVDNTAVDIATFYYGAATVVGTITTNGTNTAYNTSSDYRLKEIDGPIQNSGAYIDALKPVQGSWKADGSRFIGLIAHEVQEVSETQIATGEKDGEQMQAMDYSAPELIANLIAEIQSLRARVAQLEGN